MFPLKNREIIRGCAAHKKAGLGCATDYVAKFVPLFAPFDGKVTMWGGNSYQGGNWMTLERENGDLIQFAHLSAYKAGGEVKEGDRIATTGNTGKITTGPHLHIQIKDKDGNRIDPETYSWNTTLTLTKLVKDVDNRIWAINDKKRFWILDPGTLNGGAGNLWKDWGSIVDMPNAELIDYEYGGAIFISQTDDPLKLN